MVDIYDIPDFPSRPGQRPTPGAPSGVSPVSVVLVNAPLDIDGTWTPLNGSVVDVYIGQEVVAGRAYTTTVERWDPWSPLQLPLGIAAASTYNYARMTVDGKSWYAFASASYLNLTTSVFTLEPDDCATYAYTVGYSTWKFGHVAVAASQDDTYGINYCDAPEPIELTPEYGTLAASLTAGPLSSMKAIVVSVNDLAAGPFVQTPYQNKIQQGADIMDDPIILHIFGDTPPDPTDYPPPNLWWKSPAGTFYGPKVTGAPSNTINGVAQAGGVWVFTMAGLRRYLAIMANAPWIVQGISTIMLVPSWSVAGGGDSSSTASAPTVTDPTSALWAEATGIAAAGGAANITISTTSQTLLSGWRDTVLSTYGATAYRKLVTSAAGCSVVLTDGVSQVPLKPEAWLSSGFAVEQSPDIYDGASRVIPVGYGGLIGGELGLTISLGGSVSPAQYGLGLAHQNGSANEQQQAYQLYRAMVLAYLTADIVNDEAVTVGQLNASLQMATATMSGLTGGVMAAGREIRLELWLRHSRGFSGGSMNSTTSLALTGITTSNAWTQNIMSFRSQLGQTLPTSAWTNSDKLAVSGGGGGAQVRNSWRIDGVGTGARVVVLVPTAGRIRTILSMWNRRGYAIDRAFVPPRLDAMTSRTYWQGEDVVVKAAAPADAKKRIAARFENGTTIVTDVNDVGSNTTNAPRSGVSY